MASGKVHNRASVIVSVPTGIFLASQANPVEGLGAFLGCLLGIILTPDLDLLEAQIPRWQETFYMLAWVALVIVAAARATGVF